MFHKERTMGTRYQGTTLPRRQRKFSKKEKIFDFEIIAPLGVENNKLHNSAMSRGPNVEIDIKL